MRHEESFVFPLSLPLHLVRSIGRRGGRRKKPRVCVSPYPPLIGPEPMIDWFLLPAPLLVEHSQWMPHLQVESGPMLDPVQDTRLQRTVAILETTSLQTNLSHQVQESTGPAQHTTRRHHQDRKTKSLPPRLHHSRCCERSVQHTTRFQFRQDEPCDSFSKALASPVTTASYSVSLLVPASTICRSCPERRAFCRRRHPHISFSKNV